MEDAGATWKVERRCQPTMAPLPEHAETRPHFPHIDRNSRCFGLLSSSDQPSARDDRVKHAVFFVGNLCADVDDGRLTDFVSQRVDELGVDVTVFNTKVFPKESFSSARITVNEDAAGALWDRSFWPRAVYARRWKFAADRENVQPDTEIAGGQSAAEPSIESKACDVQSSQAKEKS